MIDLAKETLISLPDAAGFFPSVRRGKKVHVKSIKRYIKKGVRGVCLDSIRIGGSLATSVEALQRFCNELSEKDARTANPSPSRQLLDDADVERRLRAKKLLPSSAGANPAPRRRLLDDADVQRRLRARKLLPGPVATNLPLEPASPPRSEVYQPKSPHAAE